MTDNDPRQLPDHPEEHRLRKGEQQLAETLTALTKKAARALKQHERVEAFVLLGQLEETAKAGKHAMARAVDDQMKQARD